MSQPRFVLALMVAVACGAHDARAALVSGTGTGALFRSDLTDPENNGQADANVGYNVVSFFADQEASFGAGEAAFNVFDNRVGGGNDKWCCGNTPGGFPHHVGFDLGTQKVLTQFTITSSNDTPERDPRVWRIEGSNDGVNFTTIYSQNDTTQSVWTARDQVIVYAAALGDFAPPQAYSQFRFIADSSGTSGGADFALNELEFYGVDPGTSVATSLPDGGWISETFKRTGGSQITNLATADDAINNGLLVGSGVVNVVNYFEPGGAGGQGNFSGGVEPFGLSAGADDDFAVRSTGFLQVTRDGQFQFRNNTDDGSRLRIDLNGDGVFGPGEDVIIDNVLSGPHNADSAILALLEGQYMIEHVWYERGGGAEGELAISDGSGGAFRLLGNPQDEGTLAYLQYGTFVTTSRIIPEPASALLSLMGLTLLGKRRRRTA